MTTKVMASMSGIDKGGHAPGSHAHLRKLTTSTFGRLEQGLAAARQTASSTTRG